jgi:hypothetical protein
LELLWSLVLGVSLSGGSKPERRPRRSHTLYKPAAPDYSPAMNLNNPVLLAVAGLIVFAVLFGILGRYFSPESRLERRRRRNSYRVVSKTRRPMVRLNVRDKK